MSQNLLHAQPIQGCFPGREIRIIDSLHLAEVARAASQLPLIEGVKEWFADYLVRMITRKNGQEERAAENNHGTCWTMQLARRIFVVQPGCDIGNLPDSFDDEKHRMAVRHSSLLSIQSPLCH